MTAALPLQNEDLNSPISLRFGRSPYFAIINKETGTVEVTANPYYQLSSGAGKHIVEFLTGKYYVDTLIAFELGLNVMQIANQSKLRLIIIHEKNKSLKSILDRMQISITESEIIQKPK